MKPLGAGTELADAIGRQAVLDLLQERSLVDAGALERARQISTRTGQAVEQVLNQIGALSDEALADAYVEACLLERWTPGPAPIPALAQELGASIDYLRRQRLLPLENTPEALICAACDPLDRAALDGLAFAAGKRVAVRVAPPGEFRRAFAVTYPDQAPAAVVDVHRIERDLAQITDAGSDSAGSRLVSEAFEAAVRAGASDIHFEPRRNDLRVRLRLDGRLVEHRIAPLDLAAPAVSRVKVIAGLDLGERRLPQDGRTSFVVQGRSIDVRVATTPSVFGEAAVLRLLDRASVRLDLNALGITGQPAEVLRQASQAAHGLFLVSGPTGSGKTTTLYALLERLKETQRKILSVEDPVEYHFEHVTQTQVAPQIGLTFAKALRSFLRQDPDVILVGEIRDAETAAVAVQAAMTGHLVLASVHANDAPGVVPRLLDMGVEPYQLAAALKGVAAQRLVRRLCEYCRQARAPTEPERAWLKTYAVKAARVFDPVGCAECQGAGFRGRLAVAEALLASDTLLKALGRDGADLHAEARACGWRPMTADGAAKVAAGLTTQAEVLAAAHE